VNTEGYWAWPPHRVRPVERAPVHEQVARDCAAAGLEVFLTPKPNGRVAVMNRGKKSPTKG
jgi:hypothetical protein